MRCGIQLVPQDMRRDVPADRPAWQFSATSCDSRRSVSGRIDWRTPHRRPRCPPGQFRQGAERCADLGGIDIRTIAGPAPPRRHPVMIISHVASMAGCPDSAMPICRSSSSVSRRCRQPSANSDDPVHRIVGMNALAHGVAENRVKKRNGHGPSSAPITTINLNTCQSAVVRTFGYLSRDRQIIRCYLHHDRYLVTVMRPQKRLEPLANFHADAPSTDRSRRVATLCHHFVINAVIVSLLSGAEGLPSGTRMVWHALSNSFCSSSRGNCADLRSAFRCAISAQIAALSILNRSRFTLLTAFT